METAAHFNQLLQAKRRRAEEERRKKVEESARRRKEAEEERKRQQEEVRHKQAHIEGLLCFGSPIPWRMAATPHNPLLGRGA